MPRRPRSSVWPCARVALLLAAVVLVLGLGVPGGAAAQTPAGPASTASTASTSSVVPSLGTAAAAAPADADVSTVETLDPSANRPLTTSEQRLEWLDKFVIAGFVVLCVVVVLVRQRRSPLARGDRYARDNDPDDPDDAELPRDDTPSGTPSDTVRRVGTDGDDVVLDLRFDGHDPRTDAGR